MLRKLMKYEFKATGRSIVPLYGALLIFAILNHFIFNKINTSGISDSFMGIITFISVFAYGFIMAAVFVATFFIIVQRFHKNLLGKEGYLMHTLPVKPYKNILNKLLISIIWTIISCFVAFLSICIIAFSRDTFSFFITNLFSALSEIKHHYGSMPYVIGFELVLASLVSAFKLIIKLYASMSIGHLFNSKKVFLSFITFIGLSILENIANTILANIFYTNSIINITSFSLSSLNFFSEIIISSIIIQLIYFSIYFFVTNYILTNKLNLE